MQKYSSELDLIFGRRSIRAYEERPVEEDIITNLLAAAMAAPSAVAKDPWRFIVVEQETTKSRIAEQLPNGKMLTQAPLGIVVCGDEAAAHGSELGYMLQDCTAAIENLLLAAHALGLGACWLGVYPRKERVEHIRQVLAIPEPVIPVAAVALGYPAEQKQPRTRYNESFVHWERW